MKKLTSATKKASRTIKSFWRQDGHDYMATMGGFDRAIVVTYFTPNFPSFSGAYYGIGDRSYFPFKNEQHAKRFDNPFDCIEFAESIVLKFVQSLFVNDSINPKQPVPYNSIDSKENQIAPKFPQKRLK